MNGHGNARGIAMLQSVLASGGANGVRLMSDAGRERVLEQQSAGPDLVVGVPCRWGMGFSLEMAMFPGTPPEARTAWWAGNGGSLSFIDLDARMAIGYVPNRWITGPFEQHRSGNIVQAAYQALQAVELSSDALPRLCGSAPTHQAVGKRMRCWRYGKKAAEVVAVARPGRVVCRRIRNDKHAARRRRSPDRQAQRSWWCRRQYWSLPAWRSPPSANITIDVSSSVASERQ